MDYAKQRLREPSTWAGLAAVIGMGAQAWSTRDTAAIGAAVAGLLAMFMRDPGVPRP